MNGVYIREEHGTSFTRNDFTMDGVLAWGIGESGYINATTSTSLSGYFHHQRDGFEIKEFPS